MEPATAIWLHTKQRREKQYRANRLFVCGNQDGRCKIPLQAPRRFKNIRENSANREIECCDGSGAKKRASLSRAGGKVGEFKKRDRGGIAQSPLSVLGRPAVCVWRLKRCQQSGFSRMQDTR